MADGVKPIRRCSFVANLDATRCARRHTSLLQATSLAKRRHTSNRANIVPKKFPSRKTWEFFWLVLPI